MAKGNNNTINAINEGDNDGVFVGQNTGVINNYIGLTPVQASELMMDLFHKNFPKLQQEAREIAEERVKSFCNELFTRLKKNGFKNYTEFKDPDVQYILYESQKEYARRGADDLLHLLCDIIIRRIDNNNDLLKITLNEAIKTVPLLSEKQLNILSLVFIFVHTIGENIQDINVLAAYLNELLPLTKIESIKDSDIRHLNYCGCGQSILGKQLGLQLGSTYSNLFEFKKNIGILDTSYNNVFVYDGNKEMQIDEYIIKYCPESKALFDLYDDVIFTINLTSVGMLIGAINAEIKLRMHFDLEKWIN